MQRVFPPLAKGVRGRSLVAVDARELLGSEFLLGRDLLLGEYFLVVSLSSREGVVIGKEGVHRPSKHVYQECECGG